MNTQLERWAAERGYRVSWGSVEAVQTARADVAARRASGEIQADFHGTELEPMARRPLGPAWRTVVVVAVPCPATQVSFELEGGRFEAILPPTYVGYRPRLEEVRQDLASRGLAGARVEHLVWPLKATAARLGLIRYGRNNVGYAPGMGSYLQLCGYLTDAALPETELAPGPEPLAECDDCEACLSACPTGAIERHRFLLHAERCLTLANESPGEWPHWVADQMHTCLLGCLECQRVCPANPELRVVPSGVTFSAEESRTLLGIAATDDPRPETGTGFKLAWLGQPQGEAVLGRNLRALLDARRAGVAGT